MRFVRGTITGTSPDGNRGRSSVYQRANPRYGSHAFPSHAVGLAAIPVMVAAVIMAWAAPSAAQMPRNQQAAGCNAPGQPPCPMSNLPQTTYKPPAGARTWEALDADDFAQDTPQKQQ